MTKQGGKGKYQRTPNKIWNISEENNKYNTHKIKSTNYNKIVWTWWDNYSLL